MNLGTWVPNTRHHHQFKIKHVTNVYYIWKCETCNTTVKMGKVGFRHTITKAPRFLDHLVEDLLRRRR